MNRIKDYGSKAAPLAVECQEIFMAAVFAFHVGKAVVQITAVEIALNHQLYVEAVEPLLP
jgi:hypothetical protein